MVTGIVLIVIGVAAVVACRAYVHEPVLRNVGVILGVIVALVGVWFFLTALLGHAHNGVNNDVDVDGAATIVVVQYPHVEAGSWL